MTLPDLLPPPGVPLAVLFCGINAPPRAVRGGAYFGPLNRFWPVLFEAGYTPRLLAPGDAAEFAGLGHGITTLVARPTSRAAELTSRELREGVARLDATVARERPRWVGFLGIGAFRTAFDRPRAVFGRQESGIAGAGLWVLPNPSGLNRGWTLPALVTEYARLRETVAAGG